MTDALIAAFLATDEAIELLDEEAADEEAVLADDIATVLTPTSVAVAEGVRQRGVPADSVTRRLLAQPFVGAVEPLAEVIVTGMEQAADLGALAVQAEVENLPPLPRWRDVFQDRAFEASAQTMDRVVGDVMAVLEQAHVGGLDPDEAADLLDEDVFDGLADWEARRIARTELGRARAEATVIAMGASGVAYHMWLSRQDSRVRSEHQALDGEIVQVGRPFSNGDDFPGESDVNCRCRSVPWTRPEGAQVPDGPFRESDVRRVLTT